MSVRQARHDEYKSNTGGPWATLSGDILDSAAHLLSLALDERRRGVWRSVDNHATRHVPGAIILASTAFDAIVNEMLAMLAFMADHRALADLETVRKCQGFIDRFYPLGGGAPGKAPVLSTDLSVMVSLRNDLVHWLPRSFPQPPNVSPWLQPLQRDGLLITAPALQGLAPSDFDLGAKLGSYKLGCWAWRTLEDAVLTLVRAVPENTRPLLQAMAETFAGARARHGLVDPVDLHSFDQQHSITEHHG